VRKISIRGDIKLKDRKTRETERKERRIVKTGTAYKTFGMLDEAVAYAWKM